MDSKEYDRLIGEKLSVFQKGLLLVGLPIACQIVFLILLLRAQEDAIEAEKWALHTKDVIAQAEQTHRMVAQTLGRCRGEALFGTLSLKPVPGFENVVRASVADLRYLVRDNSPQVRMVDEYGRRVDKALQWVAREEALVASNQLKEAADPDWGAAGQELVDAVKVQLDGILSEEQQLDANRITEVTRARRRGNWILSGAVVGSTLLAGGMLMVFSSSIANRLRIVASNARRLADHKALEGSVRGTDEIAELDRAVHDAGERLEVAETVEREYRSRLEARGVELSNQTIELERVNRDLKLKTQENETFVYSVSHDLRSPLVNLQGFSDELTRTCGELQRILDQPEVPAGIKKRVGELIHDEMGESLKFIQSAVTRASAIIDALLRLSRAGRVEYRLQQVNISSVVRNVISSMSKTIRQRDAAVRVAENLPAAWCDPTAVDQIFSNLIGNAVNYLDPARPGVVEIGVASGAAPEDVAGAEDEMVNGSNQLVTYFVRDNGYGVPQAHVSKMFVAFQRLHGSVAPGEGIGLALVRRIVDRHGGRIWVESEEGAGTTVYLSLQAESPEQSQTTAPAEVEVLMPAV